MSFTDIFIQRPVLSWVLNIVLIMIGIVSWQQLPMRQYPQIERPIVTVVTDFEGAGAQVIEAQITKPIEDALSGVEGLDYMTSYSDGETSKVKLFFRSTVRVQDAAADIRDKLSALNKLPESIRAPRIEKADVDSEHTISLALGSLHDHGYTVTELNDYATRYLESGIASVNGVSSVSVQGGSDIEMHVVLDPMKMAGFNVSAIDVAEALRKQNVQRPGGRLETKDREIIVVTEARMSKPEQFDNIVVAEKEGYLVRLKDIGYAVYGKGPQRFSVLFNGRPAVMIAVIAQPKSNPIDIAKAVRHRVELEKNNLPKGMFLTVSNDKSIFIERSISQVYQAIFEATILVVLVVFLFLRSLRASIIPLVTIPISLVGSFFIIYTLGFTINTLTLLAMVLAIGLVVDDAIVVVENIYRYLEAGKSKLEAAIEGTREIGFSIIAMTLTLAAVYTPIALSAGMTGKLFTEFALTLAGSVIISGFVALTLSPMMCSKLLVKHNYAGMHQNSGMRYFSVLHAADVFLERLLRNTEEKYESLLRISLRRRLVVVLFAVFVGLVGLLIYKYFLQSELSPKEDQGIIRTIADAPYGATLQYIDPYVSQMDKKVASIPEVDRRLSVVQVGDQSYTFALLKEWENRKKSCEDILGPLREQLNEVVGIAVQARCVNKSPISGDRPLTLVLQSNKPFSQMKAVAAKVLSVMARHPGIHTPRPDLYEDIREQKVEINRDKAAQIGVSPDEIANIVNILVKGGRFTEFEKDGKQYPVRIQLDARHRMNTDDIKSLYLNVPRRREASSYPMVPLESLIEIQEAVSPIGISRYAGMRSVTFDAALNHGYSLDRVFEDLRRELKDIIPPDYRITAAGDLKKLLEESRAIYKIFALALIFIFLIMAAQFESFIDPFIIILSVPMALAGAVITLQVIPACSLNIYSQIGLITLIGLITKHGILIVDFANQRQRSGLQIVEAIIEACRMRLRPILMTTFAMVLGALPLALATGAGSEVRRQIGWVIVGGMSLGTIFTLFVIPVVYTYLSRQARTVTSISS